MGDKDKKMSAEEMVKAIEKCVGDECKKIREEMDEKIKDRSISLDEEQLKKINAELHEKIGNELKDDFGTHLQGLNHRVSQWGSKIDESSQLVKDAVEKVDGLVNAQGKAPEPKAPPEGEPPAQPEPPAKPPVPEWVKAVEDKGCPNCGYHDMGEPSKIVMGCPTCKSGYTKYDVSPPGEKEGEGGQGYKFCSTCGGGLVPVQDIVRVPSATTPAEPPK
jgi:hypothetical protein